MCCYAVIDTVFFSFYMPPNLSTFYKNWKINLFGLSFWKILENLLWILIWKLCSALLVLGEWLGDTHYYKIIY